MELELQADVSCSVEVLETKLGSSAKAVGLSNHRTTSPAKINYFSCLPMHVRLHHVCMYTICMPGDRGPLKEVPVQSHLQVPKLTFPEVCIVENLMELRAKIAPSRAGLDHFATSSKTLPFPGTREMVQ